jgi:PIN domain nuclease of toxin-antitoxin system
MKLLLDTHAFIWWIIQTSRLSATAFAAMQNPQNELLLSAISLWEIQLKIQLGRLRFNLPLPELVEEQQRLNGIQLLPIQPEHVYALSQLPFHHKDPFDRLLISQAITEQAALISSDAKFPTYPVQIIW